MQYNILLLSPEQSSVWVRLTVPLRSYRTVISIDVGHLEFWLFFPGNTWLCSKWTLHKWKSSTYTGKCAHTDEFIEECFGHMFVIPFIVNNELFEKPSVRGCF